MTLVLFGSRKTMFERFILFDTPLTIFALLLILNLVRVPFEGMQAVPDV